MIRRPEDVWTVDEDCAEGYLRNVTLGRSMARDLPACAVGIARNAMPYLPNTLALVLSLMENSLG